MSYDTAIHYFYDKSLADMVSRAGTIFRRRNGVTPKKSGTIFVEEQKNQNESPKDKFRKKISQQSSESDEPIPISIVKNVGDTPKDEKQAEKKLNDLIEGSDQVLYRTKNIFPFDFFPDEMVIDINKVSLISREFFQSERVVSIMLDDISDVYIDTSPFFSTVNIDSKSTPENKISFAYVKRDEAAKLRRILQGLVVSKKQTLDLANIPKEKLIPKLELLGKAL